MARRLKHRSRVDVYGFLADGTRRHYTWTTPVAFGRALSKGAKWFREELRKEGVAGRSTIDEITVNVRRLK